MLALDHGTCEKCLRIILRCFVNRAAGSSLLWTEFSLCVCVFLNARIQVSDQIIEVDGKSLVGVTQAYAASVLRNTIGTVQYVLLTLSTLS